MMNKFKTILLATAVFLTVAVSGSLMSQAPAEPAQAPDAVSTLKKMIGFIRYGKDDRALAFVGAEQIARYLLTPANYDRATPQQKERFIGLLKEYIQLKAFPLALKYFKDIDLSYDQPVVTGDQHRIRSSLLYAGSEQIVFTWVLTKVGNDYFVTDFLNERNESSMQRSRDQQVLVLYRQSGMDGVNNQLQTIVNSLKR